MVIACCFTTTREVGDFQPGTISGVGRVYPHLMFLSNGKDVEAVECSIQLDRPSRSSSIHDLSCHEMHDDISAMLVADSNADGRLDFVTSVPDPTPALGPIVGPLVPFPAVPLPPLPFWSCLFNYQLPDAALTLRNQRLHVVKAKSSDRTANGHIVRIHPLVPFAEADVVAKRAGQGEFDNVHIAPPMHLKAATHVKYPGDTTPTKLEPDDYKLLRLDGTYLRP
jgi:hypothetical protein